MSSYKNVTWYYYKETDTFANCGHCVRDNEFLKTTTTHDAKIKKWTCRWCEWCPAKDGMVRPHYKTSGYDHLVNMWSNLQPKTNTENGIL